MYSLVLISFFSNLNLSQLLELDMFQLNKYAYIVHLNLISMKTFLSARVK